MQAKAILEAAVNVTKKVSQGAEPNSCLCSNYYVRDAIRPNVVWSCCCLCRSVAPQHPALQPWLAGCRMCKQAPGQRSKAPAKRVCRPCPSTGHQAAAPHHGAAGGL